MRSGTLFVVTLSLLAAGCRPLPATGDEVALAPLERMPSEYGSLVAVTQANVSDPLGWYELWFADPETGAITHVPFLRRTWEYPPSHVKVIGRSR